MEHVFLDELAGTNLPIETTLEKLLPVEARLIQKVAQDFDLSPKMREETIQALYRFKSLLRHYLDLWHRTKEELSPDQKEEAGRIFDQLQINLDRNSLSCWSNGTFFKSVRFLLHACKKLELSKQRQELYMRWLYSFPVVPEYSIKAVFEHELYPSNQPHKYMYMLSGMLRRLLSLSRPQKEITQQYYTFLRERNIRKSHSLWFNRRYSGSYGSRQ